MQLKTILFQLAALLAIEAVAAPTGPVEPRADEANDDGLAVPIDLGPPAGWSLLDLAQDAEPKLRSRAEQPTNPYHILGSPYSCTRGVCHQRFQHKTDLMKHNELVDHSEPIHFVVGDNKSKNPVEQRPDPGAVGQSGGLQSAPSRGQTPPGSPGGRAPATA
ncbi:hypothetical protein MCOR01_003527 [Pyricularia oryzae]|nr:hypothetical protein MCOR01_003527 [Pyricularia oryzae]